MDNITGLIAAAAEGNDRAADDLYSLVYAELRKIAKAQRARWYGNDTVGTTALIHEAYIKLAGSNLDFANRKHFYATAARAMRQVLMNYAARSKAAMRSGDEVPIDNDGPAFADEQTVEDLVVMDDLLRQLDENNTRRCRIVECRVFGGMSIDDIADVLQVSRSTVKREWSVASAWLYSELRADTISNLRD